MFYNTYVRKHASCPFCKKKPTITIKENGNRIPNTEYIRHVSCPFCRRKIELYMHEYYGKQNQFQRAIHLRKPKVKEDNQLKKKKRIIKITN